MISIIIPVYNGEKYLAECVDSVLSQNFHDWELIVVDDGSTDRTAEIMAKFCNDSRIMFIRKVNSGVTETRWRGIEESHGEWVTFLDADDILLKDTLVTFSALLNNTLDILSFHYIPFSDVNTIKSSSRTNITNIESFFYNPNDIIPDILLGKVLNGLPLAIYRRKILLSNKSLFCNRLKIAEDTFFNLELCLTASPKVKTTTAKLYGYRNNPESVTRSISPARFESVKQAIDYLDSLIDRQPTETKKKLHGAAAFRLLLLWSTFMFHPDNRYYHQKSLRNKMRRHYLRAFPHLYPYLKAYLFIDLFISTKLSQTIIKSKR